MNVVTLLATVHDRDGRIVKNLTPDDFVLEEDGVPQKIRYFSQESDLPLTIGLLVDTSRSQEGVLQKESQASNMFLDQVLREGKDQAFVAHFDTRVEGLQGLTSSHSELAAALGQLTIPDEVATLLYSAVRESSHDVMKKQQGRKSLILLTDGVAYKDPTSIGTAIEFAQGADSIIYAIRFSNPVGFRGPVRTAIMASFKERGKEALERMARETGGVAYEVSKNQSIEQIYSQIGRCAAQSVQYRLYAAANCPGWKVSQDQADHEGSQFDRQYKGWVLFQLTQQSSCGAETSHNSHFWANLLL